LKHIKINKFIYRGDIFYSIYNGNSIEELDNNRTCLIIKLVPKRITNRIISQEI